MKIVLTINRVENPWIGLYREVTCETNQARRRSSWMDNSAYLFQNWSPQEPDSSTPCIMMSATGQWEDTGCNDQLHYVFEKPTGKYLVRFTAEELHISHPAILNQLSYFASFKNVTRDWFFKISYIKNKYPSNRFKIYTAVIKHEIQGFCVRRSRNMSIAHFHDNRT